VLAASSVGDDLLSLRSRYPVGLGGFYSDAYMKNELFTIFMFGLIALDYIQ
jgi:hypothetical protein